MCILVILDTSIMIIGGFIYWLHDKKAGHKTNPLLSFSFGMTIPLLCFIFFGFTTLNKDPSFIPCSAAVCEYVLEDQNAPTDPESTPTPTDSPESTATVPIVSATENPSAETPEPSPTPVIGQYYCLAQNSVTNFRKFPTTMSSVFYTLVTEETPLYCYEFISYSHQIDGFNYSDRSLDLAKIWVRMDTEQIPPNKRYFVAPYAYVRADKLLTKDKKVINPFELPEYMQPEEVFNELFSH